jgi:hypothetical protein
MALTQHGESSAHRILLPKNILFFNLFKVVVSVGWVVPKITALNTIN